MRVRDNKGINPEYLVQRERHGMKLQTTNFFDLFFHEKDVVTRLPVSCKCKYSHAA